MFLDVQDGSPTSHDRDHHGDKATQGKQGWREKENVVCLAGTVGGFAREMSAVF